MADRVSSHRAKSPEPRVDHATDKGYFYPGEAARILGVPTIRYGQLRAIYDLVREQRGEPREDKYSWARFSTRDLAGALEVIRLCATVTTSTRGKDVRLLLAKVERACIRLRAQGLSDPLLQSRLNLVNGRVTARINGVTFDTTSGQVLIDDAIEAVEKFMAGLVIDETLRTRLANERLQVVQDIAIEHVDSVDDRLIAVRPRADRRAS